MTQVSKRPLKATTEEKINQLFRESIALCSSTQSTAAFLDDLLTATEKIMLSKRLGIACLLLKGYPYDVIAATLKVSNPTIRTVSLMLNYKGNGIREVIHQFNKKQQWKHLFRDLADSAYYILETGKGGNWSRAKRHEFTRKMEKKDPLY